MGVLVLDAAYGLVLVVLHAILLGELPKEEDGWNEDSYAEKKKHWLQEFVDLDMSWGHRLLGFDDKTCLVSGLLYGLLVVATTVFTLNLLFLSGPGRQGWGGQMSLFTLRWYVVFMHVQMVLYIGVTIAKFPKLCKLREEYFVALESNCDVLRFIFAERFVYGLICGSLCIWIFGSFAYLKGAHGPQSDYLSDDSDGANGAPRTRGLSGPRSYVTQAPRGLAGALGHHGAGPPRTRGLHVQPAGHPGSFALSTGGVGSFATGDGRSVPRSYTHAGHGTPSTSVPRSFTHNSGMMSQTPSFVGGGTAVIKPPMAVH